MVIREISENEKSILEDLLYEAIFQSEGSELISRDILQVPSIRIYIDNFGAEKDDFCLVADYKHKIIGAVWVRLLNGEHKGFGNVDNKTPEFTISLFPEYRNKGIGTLLMQSMISILKDTGYEQTSLSVNKDNYAVKMYKALGFDIIKEKEEDYLMLLRL